MEAESNIKKCHYRINGESKLANIYIEHIMSTIMLVFKKEYVIIVERDVHNVAMTISLFLKVNFYKYWKN